VQSKEGDPATAATTFARSADIALATGEVRFAAYALANAVDNFLRMGAIETAARSAERALALANTIGDPLAQSTARANLGLVFARRGEWAKAEEHLLGSIEMINRLDNPYSLATRCQEIAGLYEAQGRGGDAASWRSRADGLFARLQGNGAPRPPTP
jgi:tetratricopeptide (TPR) repeat protein